MIILVNLCDIDHLSMFESYCWANDNNYQKIPSMIMTKTNNASTLLKSVEILPEKLLPRVKDC